MKKVLALLGVAGLLALGGTALSATPANQGIQKAEAYVSNVEFNACHWTMNGTYWCYRSGCSYMDWRLYGCYNGWVKVPRPWYA